MVDYSVEENLLKQIIGDYMSAVIFVMDYIQLDFSGEILSAFNLPQVRNEHKVFKPSDIGYKDKLCDQITHTVTKVDINAAYINIEFDNGVAIQVPIQEDQDKVQNEAAMYQNGDGRWWVINKDL